jgi:acyl phosphate:glycerol-3-phosphate acyltransferase
MGLSIGLLMLLSYFLGSIPSGLVIGKVFKNIDIREHGSKNTGATNAVRVLGFKYGIFAFIFDMLKGAMVIIILAFINNPDLYIIGVSEINILSLYGAAAVLGHVYPIYINFKGGKAVATTAGMVYAIDWRLATIIAIIFFSIYFATRYVSLSSMIAAGSGVLWFMIRFFFFDNPNHETRLLEMVVIILLAILIFARHKANRMRLKYGTEVRFFFFKKKDGSE